MRVTRDARVGYGFVAASQQPVVVQFVSPGEKARAAAAEQIFPSKKVYQRCHTCTKDFVETCERNLDAVSGGPSDGLLFPNDRILSVDGTNVESETKVSIGSDSNCEASAHTINERRHEIVTCCY